MKILDIILKSNTIKNIDFFYEENVYFMRYPIIGQDFPFVYREKIYKTGIVEKFYVGEEFVYVKTIEGNGFIFYNVQVEEEDASGAFMEGEKND